MRKIYLTRRARFSTLPYTSHGMDLLNYIYEMESMRSWGWLANVIMYVYTYDANNIQ